MVQFRLRLRLMIGGNWGVRIKGRPKSQESITNIFFYAGLEGFGELQLTNELDKDVNQGWQNIDFRDWKETSH